MQAMVFAAGLGTRLRPLTNELPKALVPYKGKPLLEHVLLKLKLHGFTHIVINVHHFAQKIIDFLRANDNFGLNIQISDESLQLLETGGGLYKAQHLFDRSKPILLHNVDILTDLNLREFYESFDPERCIAMLAVQERKSDRVLVFSQTQNYLCGWKNYQTCQQIVARTPCPKLKEYAFSGIHVISPRLFNYLKPGKYSITNVYLDIAAKEQICYYDHSGQWWRDMGRPESFTN